MKVRIFEVLISDEFRMINRAKKIKWRGGPRPSVSLSRSSCGGREHDTGNE
jgi:hypothetical protein